MNAGDDNSWRTNTLRLDIVKRFEEAVQKSGVSMAKSCMDIENHIFQNTKTKEDYLNKASIMITRIGQMNPNARAGVAGGQPMQSATPTLQDPMHALKAMTHSNTGANQTMNLMPPQQHQGNPQLNASNLLQTLNHQRPQLQNIRPPMQPGIMGQMGQMPQQNQIPASGIPMNTQMNVAMAAQMGASVPNVMPQQMVGTGSPAGSMVASQLNPSMMNGPLPGHMGNVMNPAIGQQMPPSPMQPSQMNVPSQMSHLGATRKVIPDGMVMSGQGNVAYGQPRCQVPGQFIRQNTPSPQASPVSINSAMVPSPASVPSPLGGSMVGGMMRPTGSSYRMSGMAPSPNSNVTLNTPLNIQSQPTPSPCNSEEQAYRDKIKQLSRFIEPLRRTISRHGNGDSEKMKKLLEILTSPGQRITMEALLKCEVVLEKMDMKTDRPETQQKEQHPLIEAITASLRSPNPNHTLHRTFEPIMSALNGKSLKNLPRALKRKRVDECTSDIPEVLQGEVARLDNRFKVSLDPVHHNGSKSVHLTCWLDDKHSPCIPPVQITIPDDYPASSPKCNMSNYEYGASKFLRMIQDALQARISKLSAKFTVSQLLDTWEMSVRETCSADRLSSDVGKTTSLLISS
ncbi:mediator of RNA polymerase II transcription subunit 15-like isoform X1 [Planococcus citri]|uniref:mediator of RNA polymerase II transcription subunit 15-like isoform X1 n=2 Tax=Planococcus citri TaxID=170843 RepID=UPI0031F88B96